MQELSVTLLVLALLLGSGAARAQNEVADALQSTLPRGWECLQGPNSLDHPGRVFYTDPYGVRYEFADLKSRIAAEVGDISAVSAGSEGEASVGALVKLLGLVGLVSASGSQTYATSVTLAERQEFRTNEAYARAALRTLDPSLIDTTNRYYVIRNTQVARRLQVTVEKGIAGEFGGDIPFTKAFTVEGAVGSGGSRSIVAAKNSETYTIDQTFSEPLTVCILAQRFTLKNVMGGAGGAVRDAQLEDAYWVPSKEGVPAEPK